jgi:hypothetical protein
MDAGAFSSGGRRGRARTGAPPEERSSIRISLGGFMSAPSATRRDNLPLATDRAPRRLSTETKAAFKTTEFFAFIAAVIAVLISAAVLDNSDAGGFGARQAWLYVTILTVGYMVSRGLAKSGSRDPYDTDDR